MSRRNWAQIYGASISVRMEELRRAMEDQIMMAANPIMVLEPDAHRGVFGREIPEPIRTAPRECPRACACCGAPYEPKCSYCGRYDYNYKTKYAPREDLGNRAMFEAGRADALTRMEWTEDTLVPLDPGRIIEIQRDSMRAMSELTGVSVHLTGAVLNPHEGVILTATEI